MRPVRNEDEIFTNLAELCASPGFVHAIAFFCSRDNLIRFNEQVTAEDLHQQYSYSRLVRTEISTLIGLLVSADIDETLPEPDKFQGMIDRAESLLGELHHALAAPWGEAFNPETKALERDPFGHASGLREPIFYGGESAHSFQYRDLSVAKYAADNDWLLANRGFRIEDAKAVATALGDLQTEQQIAVEKGLQEKPPAEWTVLPGFIFEAANLSSRSGIDLDLIDRVLDAFSLPAGHRNDSFTSLNAFNATNATPIIRREDGSYLLLQHYSLQEAIYETPFFWMAADKAYAPTALTHRGLFTEAFASECLARVFAPHRVLRNVHILRPDGNRLGEIDVLVLFGDIAVVVQAKSKRLTIEARKGNDLQLKDDFKKAIQDANDQAFLCADALITPGFKLVDEAGNDLGISRSLKTIFPLCLVSDHYPALAFQARQFLTSKTTPIIQGPLVTDVFALDVMAEMLPSPLHFLHYLNMRAQFGERLMMSHELTLLSFHLKYNLWFDDTYNMMSLGDDFAADLDIAMQARREGLPGAKTPEGILTRLANTAIGRLIAEIEAREDPPAVQLGLWLLQLNEDTHLTLAAGLDRIAADVRRDGKRHDMTVAAGAPSSGLTVHCSYHGDDEAAERLFAHCSIRKHSHKADRWFGLLVDPDTQGVRLVVIVDAPWRDNAQMDALVGQMPRSRPVWELKHPELRRKTGRNAPCPCGSGKKFKKCCL